MTLSINPRPFQSTQHDQFEVHAEGLGRYVIDVSLPPNMARDTTSGICRTRSDRRCTPSSKA